MSVPWIEQFLTNYTNKQKFVNLLACKLEVHGFKAALCPSDADTIDKFQDKLVTTLADDTDILYFYITCTTPTRKMRFT